MSHLLASLVVEAVGEVDFMVQEGALRGCRGHDGNLDLVRSCILDPRECNKPTVSESKLLPS